MKVALSALLILFALPMALWPVVWLFALARHALRGQRRRVVQVALLLPLWSVAASIGALQLAPLLTTLDEASPSPRAWVAVTSLGVAACFAAVAWLLLIRSFDSPPPGGSPTA